MTQCRRSGTLPQSHHTTHPFTLPTARSNLPPLPPPPPTSLTMQPACFFVFCCLLLLLALLAGSCSGQYNVVSVTGQAGCVNGSSPPLACTFPATLLIQFNASLLPGPYCQYTFTGQQLQLAYGFGQPYTADRTNRTVVLTLQAQGYPLTALTGRPLPLSIYCNNEAPSPTFAAGPTFSAVPPLVLSSTSGCQQSSSSISGAVGCRLAADVVTIHGSGFTILDGISTIYVSVDNYSSPSANFAGGAALTVVNDSVALLGLSTVQLPSADYLNASVPSSLSLVFSWVLSASPWYGSYTTESVALSFAPLSGAPTVAAYYAQLRSSFDYTGLGYRCGCTSASGQGGSANYSGCYPSFALDGPNFYYYTTSLYVYGNDLFNANLSIYHPAVGSVPCFNYSTQPNSTYPALLQCAIPTIAGNTAGMWYDVVVQTPTGSTTLPSVFSFVSGPVVTAIDTCYDDAAVTNLYSARWGCPPAAVLTIRGMNFPLHDSAVVAFYSALDSYPDAAVLVNETCLAAKLVSAGVITCVLPVPANGTEYAYYGTDVLLAVSFVESGMLANLTSASVYTFPDLPLITSVSGTCLGSSGPLSVSSCRAGDVLTVSGQYLFPTPQVIYSLRPVNNGAGQFNPSCSVVQSTWNDSSIQCRFDSFDSFFPLAFNVSIVYVLTTAVGPNYALWQSNPFYVSFVNATAPPLSTNAAMVRYSPHTPMTAVMAALLAMALLHAMKWRSGAEVDR